MSDDLELSGGASGIDRRDFMRKSAIVGGMVWAAPMIQSLGSPAFAFSPNGEGFPDGDISNVAFLLYNDSVTYKFEDVGGFCTTPEDWAGDTQPCVEELSGRDDKWGDFYNEWTTVAEAGSANDGRVEVSCGADEFVIDPAALYGVTMVAVKAGASCYFKDTRSLGKDEAVVIPNDFALLDGWADLVI